MDWFIISPMAMPLQKVKELLKNKILRVKPNKSKKMVKEKIDVVKYVVNL